MTTNLVSGALGESANDPARASDRLLARYGIALAARVVRELADLVRRSKEQAKAFSKELTTAITKLVARYHDASVPGGRAHRLVVVAHPLPGKTHKKESSCP